MAKALDISFPHSESSSSTIQFVLFYNPLLSELSDAEIVLDQQGKACESQNGEDQR
jgi:hypothetical protein